MCTGVVVQSVTAAEAAAGAGAEAGPAAAGEELAQYKQLIRQQDARLQELVYQLEQTQALRVRLTPIYTQRLSGTSHMLHI